MILTAKRIFAEIASEKPAPKTKCSQSELAAKMQLEQIMIERDSISRIENGTRFVPDYELPLFAKVLNVSVAWLLGID